jgi:hypothetical protein
MSQGAAERSVEITHRDASVSLATVFALTAWWTFGAAAL